jgi:hypothetical protein
MLIYFQSKSGGNFLMLEEHARILLELMDKTFTPKGIITSDEIPKKLIILQDALLAHELYLKELTNENDGNSTVEENIENSIKLMNDSLDKDINEDENKNVDEDDDVDKLSKEKYNELPIITLKQRSWPLINIMNRAHLKNTDILWGI